jgi:hypothetical protein
VGEPLELDEFANAFALSAKLPTSNVSKAKAKQVKPHDKTLQSHFMSHPPLEQVPLFPCMGTIPNYFTLHPMRSLIVRFWLQFVFNSIRRVNVPGLDWGTRNRSGTSRLSFGGMVTGNPAVVTQEQSEPPHEWWTLS